MSLRPSLKPCVNEMILHQEKSYWHKGQSVAPRFAMAPLPFLEILFALALMFHPPAVKSFTLTPPTSGVAVTWTLQADNTWQAVDATGKDLGLWSRKDMVVTVQTPAQKQEVPLDKFLKLQPDPSRPDVVEIAGDSFTVDRATRDKLETTLSVEKRGEKHEIKISYTTQAP